MTANGLRLCILYCYPPESRKNFDENDVGHPAAFFKDFFRRHAPEALIDIIHPADPDPKFPIGTALTDYDGYIWTGSDLTAYHHDDARVARQIEFARELYRKGLASYGSCWGLQIAAAAAGGEVRENPSGREWGIARDIRLTDAGKRSPLLKGKPDVFDGFIMHLDVVSKLPPGTDVLAGNDHAGVQALIVRKGRAEFWSCQYHPEYNLYEMGRLIAARAKPLVKEGHFADEAAARDHGDKMKRLHADPDHAELRAEIGAGASILDPQIREAELRNWTEFLIRRKESA